MSGTPVYTKGGEVPSYFTAVPRRAISDPDSPAISPYTHPASVPARQTRRPRAPVRPHTKTKSDEISGLSRFAVQTIDENEASQDSVSILPLDLLSSPRGRSSRSSAITERDSELMAPSTTTSHKTSPSVRSVRSIGRKILLCSNSEFRRYDTTQARGKVVHKRARSESGANGATAKSSNALPRRKTRSAENISKHRIRDGSDTPGLSPASPITPLRPPFSRCVSDQSTTYRHEIRMETPFTQLPKELSEPDLRREPPPSRRNSMIQAKAIFYAPLTVFRKLRRATNTQSEIVKTRSSSSSASEMHGPMLGHVSQLRRKRTHEALRHVSHLLRLTAGYRPDTLPVEPKSLSTNIRSLSSKSASSLRESRDDNKRSARATQIIPPVPIRTATQKSMELPKQGSDSSSIRKIRLGPPPNVTPDEHATYKVKRSPSTETEEFFKVDLSVRGGTSYLPSEARRIHTPPLPGTGLDGKRRGFFFDYNAPGTVVSDDERPNTFDNIGRKSFIAGDARVSRGRVISTERPASKETAETFHRKAHPTLPAGKKIRPVEWYDTKLAELDTASGEVSPERRGTEGASSSTFAEMRLRTAQALHEMRNRNAKTQHEEEEQARKLSDGSEGQREAEDEEERAIDYNIPEHYPNSPLCPANAKYWRFVDGRLGKGNYTRTCCMHSEIQVGDERW